MNRRIISHPDGTEYTEFVWTHPTDTGQRLVATIESSDLIPTLGNPLVACLNLYGEDGHAGTIEVEQDLTGAHFYSMSKRATDLMEHLGYQPTLEAAGQAILDDRISARIR